MYRGDMPITEAIDILFPGVRLIKQRTPFPVMVDAVAASRSFWNRAAYCFHLRCHLLSLDEDVNDQQNARHNDSAEHQV
jgi:hypothetical protein